MKKYLLEKDIDSNLWRNMLVELLNFKDHGKFTHVFTVNMSIN
jgi:hypothetical protein